MVNIYNFEKCLKVSWRCRLQSQSQWCILLQETISEFERIFVMGPEWCNFLKQNLRLRLRTEIQNFIQKNKKDSQDLPASSASRVIPNKQNSLH